MPRKGQKRKDRETLREEALRPSPYLGYGQLNLGIYFLQHKAFKLAEGQFRRAIFLNPYEPLFLYELAVCLYEQGRLEEARELALAVPKTEKLKTPVHELLKLLEKTFKQWYQEKTKGGN